MAEITKESEFAYKIAEEYRKKGYTIITHVTPADLQPLGIDFTVDALARNDTETVVIEVVSRPKLDTMPDYFRELHHAVNNTEGWRLDAGVISSLDKNPLLLTYPRLDRMQFAGKSNRRGNISINVIWNLLSVKYGKLPKRCFALSSNSMKIFRKKKSNPPESTPLMLPSF